MGTIFSLSSARDAESSSLSAALTTTACILSSLGRIAPDPTATCPKHVSERIRIAHESVRSDGEELPALASWTASLPNVAPGRLDGPRVGDAGLLRKPLAQPNYRTSGDRLDFQVVDGREHQRQPAAALLELTALLQGQPEVAAIADLGREGVGFDVRRDANQPLLARRSVLDGVCDCFGHGQP